MLTKTFVVLVIVAGIFATRRVTPGTKLPDYVDNMIHNNAESLSSGLGAEMVKVTHFNFESESVDAILDKLSATIQWADVASYVAIAKDLKVLPIDEVHSHYLFKSFPEEAVFRYALVNLYKTKEEKFGITFGQETKRAFGIMRTAVYHDVKVSKYGLPFESETVLHQIGTHKPEFHNFNREQLLATLRSTRATQSLKGLGFDIGKVMSTGSNFINQIADTYTKVATAFKTVKKTEFKQKMAGEGFASYKAASRFIRAVGIPHNNIADFTRRTTALMQLDKNPDVQKLVVQNMEMITQIGLTEYQWNMNDLTFDKSKGGLCDSMVFAMSRDYAEMKDHLLLTYVKGSFKLSKDLMIYQEYRSYAGGIYETTNDKIKKVARGITAEEIKAVHACMVLSGVKIMADELGIKIKLPELNTIINNA